MEFFKVSLKKIAACALLFLCLSGISGAASDERGVAGSDRRHVVRSGESLYTIAQDYGLAIEHLAFANGLSPDSIYISAGKELIIPCRRVLPANPPANGLVVNIPERGVFLFRDGKFEKFYPVCIGQPGRFATPQGNFTIANKAENPAWMPPEWANVKEEVVPAGPDNPLGDRWIGLSCPGIGLHSTTSPMSIGQAASHGCMRMYPNSVRELFDKVQVGWPVRIEYETAKVGFDDASGSYFVVCFPDVYGQMSPSAALKKAFEESGFEADSDLSDLARPTGVAFEIEVTYAYITVNDQEIEWPIDPMIIEGTIWGSSKVAQASGLAVAWDAENQAVEVSRGGIILVFPLKEDYKLDDSKYPADKSCRIAGMARKIGGNTILPMRPILDSFNIPHEWNAQTKTLRITKLGPRKTASK